MAGCLILILLIVTSVEVQVQGRKKKSEFSYSKESQFSNPDEFWPISSTLHGDSAPSSSLTAVLYDAVLTTGTSDLEAVEFDGTSGSFMRMTNTGHLNGQDAFSWYFNIYPFSSQTATVLEYAGVAGHGQGVKLLQEGTSLRAKVYDQSGVLLGDYSRDVLTVNSWNFIGFAYNKAWGHIDIILGDDLQFHDMSATDLVVNAVGDVTVGNSVDGSSPFNGKISCIQFYQKAMFKNALKNPPSFCSLAQWSSTVLDWTKTFDPTTASSSSTTTTIATTTTTTAAAAATTTTTTTTATTTSTTSTQTTTQTSTSTSAEATTSTPTTTSTTTLTTTDTPTTTYRTTTTTQTTKTTLNVTTVPLPTSTTSVLSTLTDVSVNVQESAVPTVVSQSTPKASQETVRGRQESLSDTCYYFHLQTKGRGITLPDIITEKQNADLTECAKLCSSTYPCVVFVISANGDCHLSDRTSPTLITSTETTSSRLYVMKQIDTNLYGHGS